MDELPDWERELAENREAERWEAERQSSERRKRLGPMPVEFDALATYNAERARGLVHTAAWNAAMAELQCQFNEWAGLT
jgi:hypothetical protein